MITPEFYSQIMAETRASNRKLGEEALRMARKPAGSIERAASSGITRAYAGPTPKLIEIARGVRCPNCRQGTRAVAFADEPDSPFLDCCGETYEASE